MNMFSIDIIGLPLLYIPPILLLMVAFAFQLYRKSGQKRDLYLSISLFICAIVGFIPYKWANGEMLLFWGTPFHWSTISVLLATGFSLNYSKVLTKKQIVGYFVMLTVLVITLPLSTTAAGILVTISLIVFGCFLLVEIREGYLNESILAYSFLALGLFNFIGHWFPFNGGRFLYGAILLLLLSYEILRFFSRLVILLQSVGLSSVTDELTGLYNKKFLITKAEQLIKEKEISIIFADIDDFKKVNDSKGHAEGDLVLQHIGTIFSDLMKDKGFACRFGGEEIVGIVHDGDANALATEFMKQVSKKTAVTISVGVATGTADSSLVIKQADERMYEAKRRGKNQVVYK